ncbi:MAG TPA: acyl-CoA dehydrogenase family protein [Polyangiaceae bacterium]|jgi:alkylation response protein AidB-like acyl-CoA dehydrogenase
MRAEDALNRTQEIAQKILAPSAGENDKKALFPAQTVRALGDAGLLGVGCPPEQGGLGSSPRLFFDVTAALAEADASMAMVYTMHVCGTLCLAAARRGANVRSELEAIARGEHLTTLAFSERGSRSHFWAPVSRAERVGSGVRLTATKSWVTSANNATSLVVSALAPDAKTPTDSSLYLVPRTARGVRVAAPWDGLGLRANDSSPIELEGCEIPDEKRLTDDGAGFKAMLEVVLPFFNLGSAAVALGLCRAATSATVTHLRTAQFEHMGTSIGEALPNLRALLANMQIEADGLAARMEDVIRHLESPNERTMLRVLESKAAAGEAAIRVTSDAMRACGGAAFSRHTSIERFFRDAHAGAVMAPTVEVLREFIGKALLGIPLF